MVASLSVLLVATLLVKGWRSCDVTSGPFGAVGDGLTKDTVAIQTALLQCNEVLLPAGRSFLTGPLNLTSNQVLAVDGTLMASSDPHDYALVQPLMGYGWGNDENCFPPDVDRHKVIVGSYRYTPVIGAYHASNVTITGSGVIDGQGEMWWENCTKCHYPPGNDSSFCEIASRPKLIETQFVDGFRVIGSLPRAVGSTTLTAPPPPPGMAACRVTTAPRFQLDTSQAVKGVHGAYTAYTALTPGLGFEVHADRFCGAVAGDHTHSPIAYSSNVASEPQCRAKCVTMNCTCFDFLAQAPPAPPTPPTPPFPPTAPPPSEPGTLTLQNSPFWTLTPSYSQNIHVKDIRIFAPMDRIGNTDGVNLDSCRNALVENVYIRNSDDGVCIKSGLDGFGLNLGIPTENVLIRNITCASGGRGGFALGSEMSGGMRNITYRDSILGGERGIDIKPSMGRGGYMDGVTFENIQTRSTGLSMGSDGVPLMPGNSYVPLISNFRFINNTGGCSFSGCARANRSKCFNLVVQGHSSGCHPPDMTDPLPPQKFACKRTARTIFGVITLPWGVCIPLDAPVNLRPDYPNWGPATGNFTTLAACTAACV